MSHWKQVYRRLPWLILIPLGLLWPLFCKGRRATVETIYCARVYPALRRAISSVTSRVPFSIAELILYALVLGCGVLMIVHVVRVLRRKEHAARLVSFLLSVLILCGALLNWFYISWGLNYFRTTLAERMGLVVAAQPTEKLEALSVALTEEANALRVSVPENADGVFCLKNGVQTMLDALPAANVRAGETYPALAGGATRAKRVLWSEGLSWLGIAGIFVGMTAEPNVNVHQPALLIPQGAAHEMAHQGGIASEDEAEFAAFLTCRASDDSSVRYSGTVNALITCMKALKKADPAAYERVRAMYGEGLLRDLADYTRYWDAYEGAADDLQTELNDAYLKFNAEESGVQSYGESVDLLLAWHSKQIV